MQKHAGVSDEEFHEILKSHILTPRFLYTDNFMGFFNDRKEKLLQRIENAMNKSIPRGVVLAEDGIYIEEETEE
ncbi:MAG: hypothetical protein GX318_07845 [Clostridia bacterium]|nr:hypothetical protein [Clostridia bacterium]